MLIICCILFDALMLVHSSTDSLQTFAYKLDQAALEIMREYDSAEEARQRIVQKSQETGGRQEVTFLKSVPIQTFQMNHPVDMVKMTIETNDNKKEQLLAISNHYKSEFDLSSTVDIYRFEKSSGSFSKVHSFAEIGPFELEYFTIKQLGATKHLLAIAGNSKIKKSTAITTRVVIYELFFTNDKFGFQEFQNFGSVSVDSIKSATRHNITYLVFGMRLDQSLAASHTNAPAQILVLAYNPKLNAFQFHSTIPANIISDIEMFEVENMLIMTIAYYKDMKDRLILNSPVYKFNDNNKAFELHQTIETRGARDIEYFQITKGHFIVIGNEASGTSTQKIFGVPSTVYQFIAGKYHHVQNLATYGAVRWKSTTVPNCQHTVLLFYADQTDSVNQVGFYMYSDDIRKFSKVPISFYDNVDKAFRPRPNTLLPFMIGPELYLAIGADDITEGHTLFKLEYSTIENRSPWETFEKEILDSIVNLSKNLTLIEQAVSKLEKDMSKFVYTDIKQNITGVKTFAESIRSENIEIKSIDISNGSIYYQTNSTLYKGNPEKFRFENLTMLEVGVSKQNEAIRSVNDSMKNYIMVDAEHNVTNLLTFSCVCLKSEVVSIKNIETSSCKINGINICDLSADTVTTNGTDMIYGTKTFISNQESDGDLNVGGKINDVKFASEVVTIHRDETIMSSKNFTSDVVFESINVTGNVNGMDLSKEALSIKKDEIIVGVKSFNESLHANDVVVSGMVDGVDVNKFARDTMSLTSDQNITGRKEYKNDVSSYGDISILGLTNGLDLDKWRRNLVSLNSQTYNATRKTIFEGEVIIDGNITIDGKFNNLSFPDDVVLIHSKQDITGSKEFLQEVNVKGDVDVTGLVDNVNLSDVVSLSGNDVIRGTKTFQGDVKLLQNLNVAPTSLINNVDISELGATILTKDGSQNISGLSEFMSFETKEGLEIMQGLDDVSVQFYEQLLKDSVLLNGDQLIHGDKSFLSSISILKNLTVNGLINGKKFPRSFLDKFSNQTILGTFNFTNLVTHSDARIHGKIGDIDVNELDRQIVTTNTKQNVKGVKTFNGNVHLMGSLSARGTLNNISISNLFTKHTEQVVQGGTKFQHVEVISGLRVSANNVLVKETVDGVDLSNFSRRILSVKGNQTLQQKFHLSDLKTAGALSVASINGVNLTDLAEEVVTLNTDQVILSKKNFDAVTVKGDLITNSTVDGIDVSSMSDNVVQLHGRHTVLGAVVFHDVNVKNLEVDGLVHNTNISKLAKDVVLKTEDQPLFGRKIIQGNIAVKKDITAFRLNNLSLPNDIVLKSKRQTINGKKLFRNSLTFKKNIEIDGKINGIDVSLMEKTAVKKNVQQVITGKKVFQENIHSASNVILFGKIDGLDLVELDRATLRIDRDQIVHGAKEFAGITEIKGSIDVSGNVNGQNITAIAKDAVTIGGSQNITAAKTFRKNITVQQDIHIDGDVQLNGLINNINITELAADVMDLKSDQVIEGGKMFTGDVTMGSIEALRLNGRNCTDFVTVHGNHTVKGQKVFVSSIKAAGNVFVSGFVDGEKLKDLEGNTLMTSAAWIQNVTGEKTFASQVRFKGDIKLAGKLDGLSLKKERMLSLHSNQNISGTTIFTTDVIARNNLLVDGLVSGVNLSNINRNRVTIDTEQTIIEGLEAAKEIICYGNISVNGTTNGVDLSEMTMKIRQYVLNILHHGRRINNAVQEMCPAIHYIKNSIIKNSPLQLDYFKTQQRFSPGINHMEPFMIGNESFLAITQTHKPGATCLPSYIVKFSRNSQKFFHYQTLPASGATKFKAFHANGSSYLFLGNREDGCLPKGESPLYKWNTTLTVFQRVDSFPTNVVSDVGTISLRDQTLFLAIANADQSTVSNTTVWILPANASKFCKIQTLLTWMPSAIEMFENEGHYYMVIAMSLDQTSLSTKTMSNVYRLENNKWMLLQQIPTAGASDLSYFSDGDQLYLVLCNERIQRLTTQIAKSSVETYKFLKEKGIFVLAYSIDEAYPIGVQHILVKSTIHYISVAVKGIGLEIFEFQLHVGYRHVLSIPQAAVTNHRVFVIDDEIYIAMGDGNPSLVKTDLADLFPRILKAKLTGIEPSSAVGCV